MPGVNHAKLAMDETRRAAIDCGLLIEGEDDNDYQRLVWADLQLFMWEMRHKIRRYEEVGSKMDPEEANKLRNIYLQTAKIGNKSVIEGTAKDDARRSVIDEIVEELSEKKGSVEKSAARNRINGRRRYHP